MSYGIEGVTIDGNNVMTVYETVKTAVEKARAGNGPTLIEAETYRWQTHFEGEPDTYRPADEVKTWKEKDPITGFEKELLKEQIMDSDEIKELHKDVQNQVDKAVEFAKASKQPDVNDVLKYVLN
jgi:TPP-dependent pyruvate/acetoin dehydrogenase alpha subunit